MIPAQCLRLQRSLPGRDENGTEQNPGDKTRLQLFNPLICLFPIGGYLSDMKKITFIILVVALGWAWVPDWASPVSSSAAITDNGASVLQQAYRQHSSNIQVHGKGTVIRILPDDLDGSRHQKFIVKMPGGQTLLLAHNIDLAPQINGLKLGDTVEFFGEYEWNAKGGVIHWTHHDPDGNHVAGWLRHQGRTYQ